MKNQIIKENKIRWIRFLICQMIFIPASLFARMKEKIVVSNIDVHGPEMDPGSGGLQCISIFPCE